MTHVHQRGPRQYPLRPEEDGLSPRPLPRRVLFPTRCCMLLVDAALVICMRHRKITVPFEHPVLHNGMLFEGLGCIAVRLAKKRGATLVQGPSRLRTESISTAGAGAC